MNDRDRGRAFQPLVPGDFILIQTRRYDWPAGYVAEYRYGLVSSIDADGRALTYRDAVNVNRMIGKETVRQSYGLPASKLGSPLVFWLHIKERQDEPFTTYKDAEDFVLRYLADLPDLPSEEPEKVTTS